MAAGAAEFLDHAHCAVVVEAVNRNRRRALEIWMRCEKVRDGKSRVRVIILRRAVMFRLQIVIEKNRIVSSRLEKLFRFVDLANDVELVSLEAFCKPVAAPLIILKQKDANWMALAVTLR